MVVKSKTPKLSIFPLTWVPPWPNTVRQMGPVEPVERLSRLLWLAGAPLSHAPRPRRGHPEDLPDYYLLEDPPKDEDARRRSLLRLAFDQGVLAKLKAQALEEGEDPAIARKMLDLAEQDPRVVDAVCGEVDAFLDRADGERPEDLNPMIFSWAKAISILADAADEDLRLGDMLAGGNLTWPKMVAAAEEVVPHQGANLWWLDAVMVRHLEAHEATKDWAGGWIQKAREGLFPRVGDGLWDVREVGQTSQALQVLAMAAWVKGLCSDLENKARDLKTPAVELEFALELAGRKTGVFELEPADPEESLVRFIRKNFVTSDVAFNEALCIRMLKHAPVKTARQFGDTMHVYASWEAYWRELEALLPLNEKPSPGNFRRDAKLICETLHKIRGTGTAGQWKMRAVLTEYEADEGTAITAGGMRRTRRQGGFSITWGNWTRANGLGVVTSLVPVLATPLDLSDVNGHLRAPYERMELAVLVQMTRHRRAAFVEGDQRGMGELLGIRLDLDDLARSGWQVARKPEREKAAKALAHFMAKERFEMIGPAADPTEARWWVHRSHEGARAMLEEGAWREQAGARGGRLAVKAKRARLEAFMDPPS